MILNTGVSQTYTLYNIFHIFAFHRASLDEAEVDIDQLEAKLEKVGNSWWFTVMVHL